MAQAQGPTCGQAWPMIYDVGLDQFRPVTQKDADMYMALCRAWGKLTMTFRDARAEFYTSCDLPIPPEPGQKSITLDPAQAMG